MLERLDRSGRGYVVFDPRNGRPRAWFPFEWMTRLVARDHLDYGHAGEGW